MHSRNAYSETREDIHPEIKAAMDAIHNPEVQEMAKKLAKYGLAVAVPHLHDERGAFLPLPKDIVAFEAGLKVSFLSRDSDSVKNGIPVMWRYDEELKTVSLCASCSGQCCMSYPPGDS